METKKFKRILSCRFGGRGKVQFRRKQLGDKVQAKSSNLPRRFCQFCSKSELFAAVSTPNIAELVLFWFFLSISLVFTEFRTHFARKNTSIFMMIGSLARRKK